MVVVAVADRAPAHRSSNVLGAGEKCGSGREEFGGNCSSHVEEKARHGMANVGCRFRQEREALGTPSVTLDGKMAVAKITPYREGSVTNAGKVANFKIRNLTLRLHH